MTAFKPTLAKATSIKATSAKATSVRSLTAIKHGFTISALSFALAALTLSGCGSSSSSSSSDDDKLGLYKTYINAKKSGGDTTDELLSTSPAAFSGPSANLDESLIPKFDAGDALFEQPFIAANLKGFEDFGGVGPAFNNNNCNNCHQRDGRGSKPLLNNKTFTTLGVNESTFLRISKGFVDVDNCTPNKDNQFCQSAPVPEFSRQLFHRGVANLRPNTLFYGQASVAGKLVEKTVTYKDGSTVTLTKPVFRVDSPYDAPAESYEIGKDRTGLTSELFQKDVQFGTRSAPPVFGMGLIEAIKESDILQNQKDQAADAGTKRDDGISGKANYVFDPEKKRKGITPAMSLGRLSWKANIPSARVQVADAFNNDMGLTSHILPMESIANTKLHIDYLKRFPKDNGMKADGSAEISVDTIDKITFYVQTLHVPARRDVDDPQVRQGARLFEKFDCTTCHRPSYTTGKHPEGVKALENQTIYPFSDFLVHDMGDDLAETRNEYSASGREWRTRQLWGIGLTHRVNPLANFLHDGRAKSVEEAVLWHGGEAEKAQQAFVNADKDDREALIKFLDSL